MIKKSGLMRIVIIEDEGYAARRLENLITEFHASLNVVAKLESVKESIVWFKEHEHPDLIFLDIHLEDDLSLAIFKEVTVKCPIIFTTATDELAIKAFQTKGISYLHKPIVQTELNHLLEKMITGEMPPQPLIDAHFFEGLINQKPT
jgi:two-component system, LytTR family, response regulator LytT